MEFVLNKIMSIDKDAQNYRKGIDELVKEKKKETEKALNDLSLSWQEESKIIKNDILEEKIREAKKKAEGIKSEKEEQLASIKEKYESSKSNIVDEVFSKIISSL